MIKVSLSKTFVNEAEFQHFKSLYDTNTSAFENVWHCEVEKAEADVSKKASCLKAFENKVVELAEKLGVTLEEAWDQVHSDMTESDSDEEEKTEGEELTPTPEPTPAPTPEPTPAPQEGEKSAS